MEEENMNLDFDIVPTVHVGIDGGSFSADVIELYELPFEKVMHALSVPNGPGQMMAMLEIFKLAIVDQTKVEGLDVLSFNELADILGQWAIKSTPPGVDVEIDRPKPRFRRIVKSDEELNRMIESVKNPDTSLEELMQIAEMIAGEESDEIMIQIREIEEPPAPRKRGRHAKIEPEIDEPLNDPGDGFEAF